MRRFPEYCAGMAMALSIACTPLQAAPKTVAPADLLNKGWDFFKINEFNQAQKYFEKALDAAKDPESKLEARYSMGMTSFLRTSGMDRDKAREIFNSIIEDAPTSKWAQWSAIAIGRSYQLAMTNETPDDDNARKAYQRVIDLYPNTPVADEAFIFMQSTYLVNCTPAEAQETADTLEKFIKARPNNVYLGQAYQLLAQAYSKTNNLRGEVDALIHYTQNLKVDANNPSTDLSAIYWKIAALAEFKLGDFKLARQYYNKLQTDYPRDSRNFGAELALKRMDDLMAQLREEILLEQKGILKPEAKGNTASPAADQPSAGTKGAAVK